MLSDWVEVEYGVVPSLVLNIVVVLKSDEVRSNAVIVLISGILVTDSVFVNLVEPTFKESELVEGIVERKM